MSPAASFVPHSRTARLCLLALGTSLLAAIGCQEHVPLDKEFVVRSELVRSQQVTNDEVKIDRFQMPQRYIEMIGDILVKLYGTPGQPRLMVPKADVDTFVEQFEQLYEEAEAAGAEEPIRVDHVIEVEPLVETERLLEGQAVYNRRCAACHGQSGDGNGPQAKFLDPRPRDYRLGLFKFTSTPRGQKPTRKDLETFLRHGARGTSMPAFQWLPEEEMQPLIDYVFMLSHRGELEYRLWNWAIGEAVAERVKEDGPPPVFEDDPELDAELEPEFRAAVVEWSHAITDSWKTANSRVTYPLTPMPIATEETIALGEEAYFRRGCASCHGDDAKAMNWQGVDEWNNPVRAADYTANMFRGGSRPIDLYRRIYSGISGSPMAASGDTIENKDTLWHLVHFVQATAKGRPVVKPAEEEEGGEEKVNEGGEESDKEGSEEAGS